MITRIPPVSPGSASRAPFRYLRLPEVLSRIGVSWMTLSRWEKQGRFPKRRKLGHRIVGWVEAEIEQWCAEREVPPASRGGKN